VTELTRADVEAAARRVAPFVATTAVLRSDALDAWLGVRAWCKAEHLQHAGAFKYRGATNAVRLLTDEEAARGVGAHSSGNHAAALALAARARGITCHVVMPRTAPASKRDLVRGFGAHIVECEPSEVARVAALAELQAAIGLVEIHPFDNDAVIAGAGTAALELLEEVRELDVVVAPVGGGGLLSGTCLAAPDQVRILGGEPLGADDAARSLAAGSLIPQTAPNTIADGLLTSLSARTFAIISRRAEAIVCVSEDEIVEAVAIVETTLGEQVEPSSGVAVAAVRRAAREGRLAAADRVGIILTGGNLSAVEH
jgi:threonine dehydratase